MQRSRELAEQLREQCGENRPFLFTQRCKQLDQNTRDDPGRLIEQCFALWGEAVHSDPPAAGSPLHETLSHQPLGQCTKCLVGVEGKLSEVMHRTTGIPMDLAERIPLHQTDSQWNKLDIERPMISILCPFDQKPKGFERIRHIYNPI